MLRSIYLSLMGITASEISRSWSVWVLDCLFLPPPSPPPTSPWESQLFKIGLFKFLPSLGQIPPPPQEQMLLKSVRKKGMVYYFLVPPLGFWLVSITLWCENHEKQTLHPWILPHQTIKCIPLESLDTSSSHLNWLAHNHNHLVIITGLDANHHGSEQL